MLATAFAIRGPDLHWDANEVADRVRDRAAVLSGAVSPGRPWALTAGQTADWVVEALAVWACGAVLAPLHADLSAQERRAVEEALSRIGPLPEGAAAILWTSGTAGSPRGVVLGWEGLDHVAHASQAVLGVGPADTWALTLSPAHMGGLATLARARVTGHSLWVDGPFDASRLDRAIEAGSVTFASLVPVMLDRLLDARGGRPLPVTLRGLLLGGAATPRGLVDRALSFEAPVFLTYGMTETSSQVATAEPHTVRAHPGTVGRPLPGAEVAIGPDGQIRVRGPGLALGFVGTVASITNPDGWYETGDLGRLDPSGLLYVTGRAGDRLISGGVNVDPVEVEEILRRHPAVADVCVVGVDDPEWGDRVVALVVWAEGYSVESAEAWARTRLRPAQRPREWIRSASIPRNRNGKIDRSAARALAERGAARP